MRFLSSFTWQPDMKSEIRNPKEGRNPKSERHWSPLDLFRPGASAFFRASDFGLRISGFGFRSTPHERPPGNRNAGRGGRLDARRQRHRRRANQLDRSTGRFLGGGGPARLGQERFYDDDRQPDAAAAGPLSLVWGRDAHF